mgnify:CR=1 FL=1
MAKYDALGQFLADAAPLQRLSLTFRQVQRLVDAGDPEAAALVHQQWWANDPAHPQARGWLDLGWTRESVDMVAQVATSAKLAPAS